jgi:hypothetical protein
VRNLRLLAALLLCSIVFGTATRAAAAAADVKIIQADTHLDVTVGGQAFTSYWFGKRDDRIFVRPFFDPVLAAGEVDVTADQYALKQKDPTNAKIDHPHHQSLWVGHGDVNGVDHWMLGKDNKGEKSAKQRHIKFDAIESDGFVEELVWDDNDAKPMLNEVRTVKFAAYPDGSRAIDLTSAFTPADGPVTFNDTKEAGLMAVRMAGQIAVDPTITQSTGKGGEKMAGEKETWGQRADWCDESGKIDGKPFGVAVFDAPANPRHPAYWHVRAYGLLAANIFGLSAYDKNTPKGAGNLVIEKGITVTFRHRAVIHTGMATDAKLDEKYKEFAGA